ncbi:cyclodeaminase [Paracoccaceae bacterium GXU_MW_L88]
MATVTLLTERDLRQIIRLDRDLIDAIAGAFRTFSGGGAVQPPVLSMALPEVHGEVDVKTAWIRGEDGFAIKVSPGFFDNPAKGLPSLNGLMMLLDAETGVAEAVLLDNGFLTAMRTAAAGGVAAQTLAPETVETAAIIGTGEQARLQAEAAHLVRPFTRLMIAGRDPAKAAACAADLAKTLGIETVVTDAEEAVRSAQLVITTTPATTPVVEADWLHPGLHITAMGSDQAGKNEIAAAALARLDLFACDSTAQSQALGEGAAAPDRTPTEIGAILAGDAAGRTDPDQITLCDLTGMGVQDTVIAALALRRARAAGLGTEIETT